MLILIAALGFTALPSHAQSADDPSVVDTWLLPSAQFGISNYFDLVSKLTPEQARAWILYANMKGYQIGGEKGLENITRAIGLLKGGSTVEEIAKRAETVGKIAAALDFLISFANTADAAGGIVGGDYDPRGLRDFAWNGLKASLAALSVAGVSIGTGGLPILIGGLVTSIDFAISTYDQYRDSGEALDQETLYGSIEQHTQLRIRTGRGRNGGRAPGDPAIKTDERAIAMVYNWCLQDAGWDRRVMSYVASQTGQSGACRDMDANLVKGQISLLLKDLDRDWRNRETQFVAERNARVKAMMADLQKNLLAVQAELAKQPVAEGTPDTGAISGDTLQLDQAYGRYRQAVAALPEAEKYAVALPGKITPIRTGVQEYQRTQQGALINPNQAAISDLTKEINRQAMQLVAIPNEGATDSPRKLAILSGFRNAYTDLIGLAAQLAPVTAPGQAPAQQPPGASPGKKPETGSPPPASQGGEPGTGAPPRQAPPPSEVPGTSPPQPAPKPTSGCSGSMIPLYNDRNQIWKCVDDCKPGKDRKIDWDAVAEHETLSCIDPVKADDDPAPPPPKCAEGEKIDNVWDAASGSYKDKCIAPAKDDPPGCVYGAPGCSGYKPPEVCVRGAPGCEGYKPPEINLKLPAERQMNWGQAFALIPTLRHSFATLYSEGKVLFATTDAKLKQAKALAIRRNELQASLTRVCSTNINLAQLQQDPLATRQAVQKAFGPEDAELDVVDPEVMKRDILKFRSLIASAKSALLGASTLRNQYKNTRNVMDGLLADWAVTRRRYDEWFKKNEASIAILNDNLSSIVPASQSQIATGTGPSGLPDLSRETLGALADPNPLDDCLTLQTILDTIDSRIAFADSAQKAMASSYPGLLEKLSSLQARMKEISDYVASPAQLARASNQDLTRLAAATSGKGAGSLREDIRQVAALVPRNQVKSADGKIRELADKRIVLPLADLLAREPQLSMQFGNLLVSQSALPKPLPPGAVTSVPPPSGGPTGAPGTAAPGHGAAPSTSQAGASQASPGSAPSVAVVAKSATAPSAFAESPVERPPGGASAAAGSQGAQEVIQIRELYQKFVQSYQSKNLNGVLRAMTPQWQASDGSGLADLEDTLRNSFRVFDVIQFRIEGLQVQKSGSDSYNVSYAATLSGRINRLNVKHEETSNVQDVVKLTPEGPRIVKTTGNVTIKAR